MPARYPRGPSAETDRPDVYLPEPLRRRSNRLRRGVTLLTYVGAYLLAIVLLAVLLFIPVLVVEVGRIDAVVLAGEFLPAGAFAVKLGSLFLGTAIVATALVSFVACAALSAGSLEDRIPEDTKDGKNPEPTYKSEGVRTSTMEVFRV